MTEEDYSVPQRRFSDAVNSFQTVILDRDIFVFGKALRAGTVLRIIGRREIRGEHYFVVTKDTWESLLPVPDIFHLVKQ
jgi:hypothetical protein